MAHIFQINISPGGVPKLPIHSAEITELGITGDKQKHTEIHGGPERALCLYSLERILELQKEGHPIFPGAAGENITISGTDWDTIKPGTRILLGSAVTIEITRPTTPCKTIHPYFNNDDSNRIHDDKYPGWSRFYAKVITDGKIKIGDPVRIF